MRPDCRSHFAKKRQKTLLVGERRATQKIGQKKWKKLNRSNNQASLQMCTKNHDRVIRNSEVMAMDWPHTSYYDSSGFRHFEDVAKH